jgi:hypothetical protein
MAATYLEYIKKSCTKYCDLKLGQHKTMQKNFLSLPVVAKESCITLFYPNKLTVRIGPNV